MFVIKNTNPENMVDLIPVVSDVLHRKKGTESYRIVSPITLCVATLTGKTT